MSTLIQTSLRRGILRAKALRQFLQPAILFFLLLLFPAVALAQSGSPFDTGSPAPEPLHRHSRQGGKPNRHCDRRLSVSTGKWYMNSRLATASSSPDGLIAARLDDSRQIEFNADEHRHFDHGYAVTSHSSQGLTAERVLIQADTSVHPDLLSSRFGHVAVSRGGNLHKRCGPLARHLGTEVSETSALEISDADFISQGMTMT